MKLTFSFSIKLDSGQADFGPEQRDTALDAMVEHGAPASRPELISGAERHSIDDDFGAGRRIGFQRS